MKECHESYKSSSKESRCMMNAKFEVFMAVKFQVVLWVVMLHSVVVGCLLQRTLPLPLKNEVLQNVGIIQQHYMASQPRRPQLGKSMIN
jgi:hypothetical protein